MSAQPHKKAPVVLLNEARQRLRQVNPAPSRQRQTRPRWVVMVAASLAVILLLGIASRLAVLDGLSGFLTALGILGACVPLGLLWLANRAHRDARHALQPPAPLRRNTPSRHRPPSRPSRLKRSDR